MQLQNSAKELNELKQTSERQQRRNERVRARLNKEKAAFLNFKYEIAEVISSLRCE